MTNMMKNLFLFLIFSVTFNYFVKTSDYSVREEKISDSEDDSEFYSETENEKLTGRAQSFLKSKFLLNVYDKHFYETVTDLNVRRIIGPVSADYVRTTYFSISEEDELGIVMKRNDLKLVHLSFAASSIKEASAEQKFASGYVQYLAIMHMLNFRIGSLFFQKATLQASPRKSALCSKMAAYLNIYNMVLIDQKLYEFSQIGQSNEKNFWSRWWEGIQNYENPCELANTVCRISKNMANIKKITEGLNEIVELSEIKKQYPLQPMGPTVEETLGGDEINENFEFTLPREFYVSNSDKGTAGILEKWEDGPAGEKQYYFYREAWKTLLELYSPYLPRLINYFNSVLFETSPKPLHDLYSFIPSYKDSLAIWNEVEMLEHLASADFQDDDERLLELSLDSEATDTEIHSNIIKVLNRIEITKAAAKGISEGELLQAEKMSNFSLMRIRQHVTLISLLQKILYQVKACLDMLS